MTGIRRVSQVLIVGLISAGILFLATFSPLPLSKPACAEEAFNPNPRSAQEAIDMLVMANRILSMEGIFDIYGHVSIRNPENPKTFFIARAIAPEQVTKKDILEVDFEGNVVTQTTMKPYQERIIHASIYKVRPDVNSVIHSHPEPIIAFSVSDVPLRPIVNQGAKFFPSVPVYDEYDFVTPGNTGMLVTTKDQGERLARRLGSGLAVLMRGHGYTVVGSTLPGAVDNAISLRDNAVISLMALQLGKPKYLSAEECKGAATGGGSPERAWNAWVQRVRNSMPDMR